jgi:hypothetical protein
MRTTMIKKRLTTTMQMTSLLGELKKLLRAQIIKIIKWTIKK